MRHEYMQQKAGARAMGRDIPISPKVAIEISNHLRGRRVDDAIRILNRVVRKEEAIPYKRFPNGVGHKPGMAAGRYPIKAAGEFLKLLQNAKANAGNQGLSGELKITHIAANRANEPSRNRAKERIKFKRAHVEVILAEPGSASAGTIPTTGQGGHAPAKRPVKVETPSRPETPARQAGEST